MRTRRKFTHERKHSLLQEAEREDTTEVPRRHNLSLSALSYEKKPDN